MAISDRIEGTIEKWSQKWGDRLATWGLNMLARGATKTLEDMEPGAIAGVKDKLLELHDDPNCPADIKALIDKVVVPGNPFLLVLGVLIMIATMTGTLNALMAPINRAIEYKVDRGVESYRMDPISIITAWRRDPAKYAKYFDDLKEQGWSDERIEALKFYTLALPSPRDVVAFLAHEVFEPDMIDKYTLLSEWDKIDKEFAKTIGVGEDILKLYWMDHWEHPQWMTIRELRHREKITDQDVRDWFRVVEIPEYWRPAMLEALWDLPNRIEIRMMARYLDMSKEEIEELLGKAGLHPDYRSDTADFMIIMGLTGYWDDMLRNGWMTPEQLKADIEARRLKPVTAERIYKSLVKYVGPAKVAKEKELTKTEIYKGIKQGRITRAQGLELLMDINYGPEDAIYLLDINIPEDEEDQVVKERQLTKADILSGLKAEVITRDEARQKLLELRYSVASVDLLLKIYDAQVKPPEEPKLKEASKADIVLGVKKGIITQEEGYLMLLDIDFSPEAASFILTVQTEESPFSPINYSEFKSLTEKYRAAAGMEVKAMPEELKKLADQVVSLTNDVSRIQEELKRKLAEVVEEEALPAEERDKLNALRTTLYRTQAELERVKADYQRQLAVWRRQTAR